jgi:hypothetical protein
MATTVTKPAPVAPATAPAPAPATAKAPLKGNARWLAGNKMPQGITPANAKAIPATAVITVLVTGNPKRKAPALRFAKYHTGMLASQYAAAIGNNTLAMLDLAWDFNHGYIGLSQLPAALAQAA